MTERNDEDRIEQAAQAVRRALKTTPDVLLVLGSGLGALAGQVENAHILPYDEIPGFPRATVPGHEGRLVLGRWSGRQVAVMQGRFHYYEGHPMRDVVLPIRVMQHLGVSRLLLTNAAGGVNRSFQPGDLMLIQDHIGLLAESPLRGANLDRFGPRFPDQTHVYDPEWSRLALRCAAEQDIALHQGIYCWCRGPQYETPAEIRALAALGADAVGMSTVPEAIAASHGGMKVLGLSCITNMAAGILDVPLTHADVMQVGAQAADKTIRLLSAILARTECKKTEALP
ncbi:MAG: purine-nucleoside phosphorylase [Eubacteriales bacterium]|nr:purine-nucleoside phosphorylase [Eubacteriales bacterium]MDD4745025.1 purine-nucleoside phosphorylase [Eubacteriales bacterium]